MTPWVDSGTLTQPKGVKGRLGVLMAPGFFALTEGMSVVVVPPLLDKPRTHLVTASGLSPNGAPWVELSGVTDRDGARELTGRHCLVRQSDIEIDRAPMTADQARDWRGWTVVDEAADYRATVEAVQPRPLQPLLLLRDDEGGSLMAPLADELIDRCDEATHTLYVTMPPGLWSL